MNTYQDDQMTEKEIIRLCLCHTIFINFKVIYRKLKKCLNSRSSHQSCPIEKAVFKNFAIFTGKQLCWSLLLIAPGFKTCNFPKKGLRHRCFPVKIAKFLRTLGENLRTTVTAVPASYY